MKSSPTAQGYGAGNIAIWGVKSGSLWAAIRTCPSQLRDACRNPNDLAQGSTRFAAMPRGFTSTADASAPDRLSLKSKIESVLILLAVWMLFAMMAD